MSKGSWRRPTVIEDDKAAENWRKLFGPSRLEQLVQQQEMAKAKGGDTSEAEVVPVSTPQGEVRTRRRGRPYHPTQG